MAASIIKNFGVLKRRNIRYLKPVFFDLRNWSTRYGGHVDPLPNRYGGKTNVTILPGTGVGPEIMESTLKVLDAAEAPLSYEILNFTQKEDEMDEFENALTSIRRNRVALKANIEVKSNNPGICSRNMLLRKTLDLYVFVLWGKTYPGLRNRFGEIDIVVVRQNTEGEYLMLEHEPTPGSVESLKVITRYNSERVAEYAFKYAKMDNRRLVTVVHTADVQVITEGLFVQAAQTVSLKYPEVKLEVVEVGVAVIQMMKNPKKFDIILASNLNGAILSNFISGMLGGPGLCCGMNCSSDGIAVFEPGARNKGSSIVGQGIANPIAMIMAGINLLDYLGHDKTADILRKAILATLLEDKVRTQDLGGTATTTEITNTVIKNINNQLKSKSQKKEYDMLQHKWRFYCFLEKDRRKKN